MVMGAQPFGRSRAFGVEHSLLGQSRAFRATPVAPWVLAVGVHAHAILEGRATCSLPPFGVGRGALRNTQKVNT